MMPIECIAGKIYLMRNEKAMLYFDLAELYGVETRVLVQAVKRKSRTLSGSFHVPASGRRACLLEITNCDSR